MLAFGEVRPLAVMVNIGAIPRPLGLNSSHDRRCVFLARFFQIFHGLVEELENIVLFWSRESGFRYPHLSFYSWVVQGRLLLLRDWGRLGGIKQGSQCLNYELGLEIPFRRGLRNPEGMPDGDFEHERNLGKDQAGYRCRA